MQTKFTPSVNIIRDSNREMTYFPTPNAARIVQQVQNDFKSGMRSFNIIGSYGTGKSAFLLAFQQSLSKKKKYFDLSTFANSNYEVINFVGEYKSITSVFAEYFEVKNKRAETETILSEIFNRYYDLGKKKPLLVITIDEFGKFLEFAAQNSPEKELYFIQQLAEFANNPEHNILLLTTVHQNFDAYALALSRTQKQEWTKVKGRFKDITFNEPIEQLLFLASEHLSLNVTLDGNEKTIKKVIEISQRSKLFSGSADYIYQISEKLYPLDIVAAHVMTVSLQKYGQNERSLFSFLESRDHTGINSQTWQKTNPFYNLACVYDYIVLNLYSFINSRYNPDYANWAAIKSSLEQLERTFDTDLDVYAKLIKSIGLLNILSAGGSVLDRTFYEAYAKTSLGINSPTSFIEELERRKLILYRNYNKRYILFEGTDLDIQSALIAAADKVSEINDVPTLLNKHYQLPLVFAKQHSYLNGTPRLFEYRITDYPINEAPEGEIDGFINLIFNEVLTLPEVKRISGEQKEAILYGFYRNSKNIRELLFEIEKTKRVIEEQEVANDKVAIRELNNILQHQQILLNHKILNSFYSNSKEIVWIYNGEVKDIPTKKDFNKQLSQICEFVYNETPVFNNELVNKHKISSSIHTAKKNYLRALVENWDKPDLGFDKQKFPPEKTIYLSLLKENGIDLYSDSVNIKIAPSSRSTFKKLWKTSEKFLSNSRLMRKSVQEFSQILSKRPYKLKQGFIDFWISTFLFIKRNDFALFNEGGYIPTLTEEVLELLIKYPGEFQIKAFDIEGVKLDIFNSYRVILNQSTKDDVSNATFIETIRPFLTFYKGLPEYSKSTKRLNYQTILLREAIVNSKDPEQSFFEDFPLALGFSLRKIQQPNQLQSYVTHLQNSIRELRSSYDGLVNRFEEFLLGEFVGEKLNFIEYKERLRNRFTKLKIHLLLPYQKTFVQRLQSELDDRRSWLTSIAQAVTGKTLESFRDEDEIVLYDKFKSLITELDTLTSISRVDLNEEKEEIFGLEITSFVEGVSKQLIRFPKSKRQEIDLIQGAIMKTLSNKDRKITIAAVATVLKDLLKK